MAEHPFQRAGLGLAPFRCVGVVEKVYQACSGAPVQAAGTCDYCGTGIRYVVQVKSADGKSFEIGTDCASKLYKESNQACKQEDSIQRAIREHKNKLARESRERRELEVIANLSDELSAHEGEIKSRPHPSKYWAEQGQTLWDYHEWHLKFAGRTGKIAALNFVKRTIGV